MNSCLSRLRSGGRALGSALSWEEPQNLQAFPDSGPFAGLPLDQNVTVSRQVLAEPDMDLPDKVWASLADGTPLVTAKRQGKGLIVLFHVTANADWSNLPLSGLFVEMLRRINDLAPGAGGGAAAGATSSDDRATAFIPRLALSAAGELIEPLPDSKPISPADIEKAKPTPETPAGLYNRGSAERAINLLPDAQAMTAITTLPNGVTLRSFATPPRQPLAPLLFTLAFLLFLGDTLAALFLGGGWHRLRGMTTALLILLVIPNDHAMAQAADDYAQKATQETRLAYVRTGDDTRGHHQRARAEGPWPHSERPDIGHSGQPHRGEHRERRNCVFPAGLLARARWRCRAHPCHPCQDGCLHEKRRHHFLRSPR